MLSCTVRIQNSYINNKKNLENSETTDFELRYGEGPLYTLYILLGHKT